MAPTVAEIREDPRAQAKAVWLTGIIGGIQMVDPVVASLALPKAGKALGMDAATLALAASISTFCLAATVVLIGSLAERTGRRKMLSWMLALAIVGNLIVLVAPVTGVYMLGRAVAGVAVGGGLACAYAYVRVVSPDERLGRALGFWAALSGVLAIPASLVGAGLANVNWRLAFLVVPVVSLVCLLYVPRLLPKTPKSPERRQLVGVVLAGLGVVGLLYGLSQAANSLVSPTVLIPAGAGILLLAGAALVGIKSERPSYPVSVFRDPGLLTAALAGALWNLCIAVAVLQTSNLWQYSFGAQPFTASVLQVPANVGIAIGSFGMGRLLSKRIDFRVLMFAGFLVSTVGFVGMGLTSASALSVWFNLGLVGAGFGAGAAGTVQSQVLLDAAPEGYLSAVAASRTTFGQIGYACGLAGSAVLTTQFAMSELAGSSGDMGQARNELNAWLISEHAGSAGGPIGDAYRGGFAQSMYFWAAFVVITALICVVLLTLRMRKTRRESAAVAEPA